MLTIVTGPRRSGCFSAFLGATLARSSSSLNTSDFRAGFPYMTSLIFISSRTGEISSKR